MNEPGDARVAASIPPLTEEQARRRREYVEHLKGSTQWGFDAVPDDFEHTWEMTIIPELVQLYTGGVEDFNLWYETESPFGGPIVPPFFFSKEAARCFSPLGPGVGRIHTGPDTEILEPVFVGTTVRFKAKLARKYFKRGRRWLEMDIDVTDAATDKLVARVKRHYIGAYAKKAEESAS